MPRLSEQQQELVNQVISAIKERDIEEVERISKDGAFRLDQDSYNRINEEIEVIRQEQEQKEYRKAIVSHIKQPNLYPNHYTCALLAQRAYFNEQEDGFNLEADIAHLSRAKQRDLGKVMDDWELFDSLDDRDNSGYYGAIYINHETKQVVIAHRGTESLADLNMDADGVVLSRLTEQHMLAYGLTKLAIDLVKKGGQYEGYSITATGHSLGGWLAQLSVFHAHNDFNHDDIRAVTFDSPGAGEMINGLQSNIYGNRLDINKLDIVEYVSTLNLVNSCNTHIGTVYQVKNGLRFKDIWVKLEASLKELKLIQGTLVGDSVENAMEDVEHIQGTLTEYLLGKVDKSELLVKYKKGLASIESHRLEYIVETFNKKTSRPYASKLVKDWPLIKHIGDNEDTLVKEVSGITAGLLIGRIPGINKVTAKGIEIGTNTLLAGKNYPLALGDVLVSFLKGEIDLNRQYFEAHKFLSDNFEKKSNEELKEEFHRLFGAHYRLVELEEDKGINLSDKKKIGDNYIIKLKALVESSTSLTTLTEEVIRSFNEQFNIETDHYGNYIFTIKTPKLDVHIAREQARYIVSEINPEDIKQKSEGQIKGESGNQIPTLASHIEIGEVGKFIRRLESWGKLKEIFQGSSNSKEGKLAIIQGQPGTGKTTLSVAYAKENFDIVRQVKGVNSEDGIYQEYLNLARQLNIPTNFKGQEDLDVASLTSDMQGSQKESQAEKKQKEKEFLVSSVHTKLKQIIESGKSIVALIDDLPFQDAYKTAETFFNNLRANGINIIVTTQHNNVAPGISKEQRIKLEGFSDDEAKEYLKGNIEGLKESDIKGLIELTKEEAKTLPQVLKAVVGYFNKETDITFGEYKNKYEQAKEALNYEDINLKPAYKVLLDSIIDKITNKESPEEIKKENLEAWKLLQYLEYLSPTAIPTEIFMEIPGLNFAQAKSILYSKSLITSGSGRGFLNTHQIVQGSIKQYREYLKKVNAGPTESLDEPQPQLLEEEEIVRDLFQLIIDKFESFLDETQGDRGEGYYAKLRETNSYLPHALKLLKETDYADSAPEMYYYMYDSLGRYHEELGAYGQAIEYYEESIERIGESEVEERSDFLVGAHIAIGNCYEIKESESIYHQSPQGLDKAKENYEEALKLVKGHDKSSAAYLSYRIGNIYRKKLEFKEAYKKFDETIRIGEEQKEEDRDQGFIAKVYQAMGDTYIQEGNDLLNIISVEESYQKIKDYLTPGTHMLGRLPEGISSEERQDIMKHQQNLIQDAFHWAFLKAERDTEKIRESIIKGNEGSSPADLYEKALEYIQTAIEIMKIQLQKAIDNPSEDKAAYIISMCVSIADNYRKIGDKESALTYYSKALEKYKNVLPEGWHEVIGEYQEIVNNQEVEQPIGYCQDFLSFLRDTQSSVFPVFRKTIKDAYVKLGDIYYELNNLEKAAKYYNKALELEGSEQEDATLKEIVEAYKGYGESCQDKEEAIEYYKEALELLSNPPINLAYQFSYHLNSKFLPSNKYKLAVNLYEKAFKWIKDQGISKSYTTSTDRGSIITTKHVPLEGFDNTLFEALKNIGDNYVEEGAYELAIKHYAGTFELVIPNKLHLSYRFDRYEYFSELNYKEMSMLYSSFGLNEEAQECLRSKRVDIRKIGVFESTIRPLYLETRFKEMLQTIYEKTKQGIYSEGDSYDLNSYLEDSYLQRKLEELGEKKEEYQMERDIEKVQLLMLRYVSMAIVHGGMEYRQKKVLKSLAKDHVTLIFQARDMGVSCFIDKRIVEVLREVEVDDNYQYQQALYNILEDFILKDVYERTINGNRYGEGGSNNNGVKQYLEDNFLQKYLGQSAEFINNVYSITSLGSLKLDIFKEVCEAIVHNGMEHIEIIRSIAEEYKDIVIDAFFYRSLEKEIVEALKEVNKNDQEYQTALEIISLPYYARKKILYKAYIEAKRENYDRVTECIGHEPLKEEVFSFRNDEPLENKLLILKYVSKAIVDSGMEHVGIIEALAKDYRELIIKAAQERPDYFLDKKIAENLLKIHTDDNEYQEELKAVSVLLGVKAQIKPTLDKIYNQIKEANDNGGDNSELNVRQYLEDNSLKRELGNLYSAKNLEVAKLLVLKYIIQAIMSRNDEKYTSAIKEIAVSDKELIIKAIQEYPVYFIQEHPGYFISWKVIKALQEIHTEDGDYQTALKIGSLPGDLNRKVKSALYEAYIQTKREDYEGVKKGVEQCSKDEDKLLVLKYVSKAIVDSGMEHVGIIEALAKDYKELIIKAAQEHPDYFQNKGIIEALQGIHMSDDDYQTVLEIISLPLSNEVKGTLCRAYIQTKEENYEWFDEDGRFGVKWYLRGTLENKLLVLKYVSKAIVDSGMEHVGIIEALAKDYKELIIKAAQERPDYFLDKKIVEHLLKVHTNDNEYQSKLIHNLLFYIEPKLRYILGQVYDQTTKNNYSDEGGDAQDWGVKQYLKDSYLLRELESQDHLELARLLAIKHISMAIMDNGKENTEVITKFAKEHPNLIIKVAKEYPDYFIEKAIVKALKEVNIGNDEYQAALDQFLVEKDTLVESMDIDSGSMPCKVEAGEGQNSHPDDEGDGDNASAGGGSSGNAATTSSSQAGEASSPTSDGGGRSNNGSSNKESGATDSETPPSKSALLAVIEEIESHGALIHDERLKVQLEHYAKTGVVYKTLAPYVEAAEAAHPTPFREDITQQGARDELQDIGEVAHINQELVDKIVGSIAERAGISYDEKLAAQAQHFVNTGNIYDTLHAYLYPQRLIEEMQQREAEEQVHEYEHNQTNSTTCATEVRVPSSEHEAPSYIDLAS